MSETFLVSARKFRPDSFDSLLGQDAVRETLRQSILQQKTAHAYLFCGPRGVGKTSAARIFAKAINCLTPLSNGEACGECESCKAFQEQRSINIFELDAASNNSTDDIRKLIEEVSIPPQLGKYRIYIIDEVHMLSTPAFNTFLKTLEEPPEYVIFILATTEKHKILPTIISRCQVYDFRSISVEVIAQQLYSISQQEHIEVDPKALQLIARKADGGMRDALSLFDRIVSFTNGNVTYQRTLECLNILDDDYYYRMVSFILREDTVSMLLLLDELIEKGFDTRTIIGGLADFFRQLLLAYDPSTLRILNLPPRQAEAYNKMAQHAGKGFLYRSILRLIEHGKEYRYSNSKRLLAEMTLLSLTPIGMEGMPSSPVPQTSLPSGGGAAGIAMRGASPIAPTQKQQVKGRAMESPLAPITPSAPEEASEGSSPSTNVDSAPAPLPRPMARTPITPLAAPSVKSHLNVPSATSDSTDKVAEEKELLPESTSNFLPFTLDNVHDAWKDLDHSLLGDDVSLRSAVTASSPTLLGEHRIEIPVVSKHLQDSFERITPKLLTHFRALFGVPDLEISFVVSEALIAEHTMQTPDEWWDHELQTNEPLQNLIRRFDLRFVP